jgi:hypothetical protein
MNLSDVRVIMMIIRVLMEELLCQTVIPVLKHLLSGARWMPIAMSYHARY